MATMSASDMADFVLERLGVKAQGQAASGAEGQTALVVVEAVFAQLQRDGVASFELSAIPEWAQLPFANMVAVELAPSFGITGERMALFMAAADKGHKDIAAHSSSRPPIPIKPFWF